MRLVTILSAGLFLVACTQANSAPETGPPDPPVPGKATQATAEANKSVAERLPIGETSDFQDASRGLIAQIKEPAILDEDGNVAWSIPQFDFLTGDSPDTVNPSLWRQSKLAAQHGLFEVADGIWQVRGYDLAVMTVIRGETGWIIVDPLTRKPTGAAALKLVNDTLGERPVTGVLYTHSHTDHFGGVRGVIDEDDAKARNVPILAPEGFSHEAVSEFLMAGSLMSRRAVLMFGMTLPRDEENVVGIGLGPAIPTLGAAGLIMPTEEIAGTGVQRIIDGVTFEFINANGTEAPAEFMFYLPEHRALCTAEVATATFHNVLTTRGAKVRDALKWSKVIDDTLQGYGDKTDVIFASHHWPTWGNANAKKFLTSQRDIYRYVHDQTMRRANAGMTPTELAEDIPEPQMSQTEFSTRGYYGTLNHNAKAVYQHYFGWFSGVPAEYYELPHVQTASRYVEAMGGMEKVLEMGAAAFEAGDYRWAAEILNHAVFADPANQTAKDWLAAAYEQIGFQAESGSWRSYFLTAASELRNGVPDGGSANFANPDFVAAVPTRDLFDSMAARYDPAKLGGAPYTLAFDFSDTGETVLIEVNEDVMVPRLADGEAGLRIAMKRSDLDQVFTGGATPLSLMQSGAITLSGQPDLARRFFGSLDRAVSMFPVVTP